MRTSSIALALVALSATGSAQPASVAGGWMLTFNGPQGPVDANATFEQDRENVTGLIDGPQGQVECSGTLKESKLALSIMIEAGGRSLTIYMLGDVDGETVKGTFSMGELGSGEWAGKKKS